VQALLRKEEIAREALHVDDIVADVVQIVRTVQMTRGVDVSTRLALELPRIAADFERSSSRSREGSGRASRSAARSWPRTEQPLPGVEQPGRRRHGVLRDPLCASQSAMTGWRRRCENDRAGGGTCPLVASLQVRCRVVKPSRGRWYDACHHG
jgi:hypothetical protein